MALIPVIGIPSSWRVPGAFLQIAFNQGASTAAAGARRIIYVMPKLAASGSWTENVVYEVNNEQTAIDGGGVGSPIHRALRRSLRVNKNAKHFALPYLPSVGGGLASATSVVTFVTDPTGTGTASVWVTGELSSTAFVDADTVTTIADRLTLAINAKEHLPVTAGNVAGVLTLTAKIGGVSQGDGTTAAISVRSEVTTGAGTTVSDTGGLGQGAGAVGADGATTEATQLTTALAVIDAARYYYIGCSVWDTAGRAALVTHISNKSEPNPGLRSVGVTAFTGALAAGQTLATADNYERLQTVWQPSSEQDPAYLVANMIGVRQKYEELRSHYNFDGFRRSAEWLIPAPNSVAAWPDQDDQNDAITDGLTPIASDDTGSFLVMSTTTRSKNAAGAVDDFRSLETHRVSVADEFADTLLINYALTYEGFALKNDELLPGTSDVNPNQRRHAFTTTPSQFKPFVRRFVNIFDQAGKLQNVAQSIASIRSVKDPNNGGRLEVGLDLTVVDLLHQLTVFIAETSTG